MPAASRTPMFHPWKNTAVKGHTSAEDERTVQLVAAKYLRSLDNHNKFILKGEPRMQGDRDERKARE